MIESRFITADQEPLFKQAVNEALSNGWRIIPGTVYATSYQRERGKYDGGNSPYFSKFFCVAVEREGDTK